MTGSLNPNWKGGVTFKKCIVCGGEFQEHRESKYCSLNCYYNDIKKNLKKTCLNCGKEFNIKSAGERNRKYCSLSCFYTSPLRIKRNKIEKHCETCGKTFFVKTDKAETAKYCSRSCKATTQFKGKHQRDDIVKARSKRLKGVPNPFFTKFNKEVLHKDPIYIAKRVKAIVKKPNKKETQLINIIRKNNLPYKYVGDGKAVLGRLCPDFIDTNETKTVIELFGRAYHDPSQTFIKIRPLQTESGRRRYYSDLGFKTIIIWDDELNDENLVLERINIE